MYNRDTDPVIIAARERGRAQGLEFSRKLNAALERMKTAMAQTQGAQPIASNGESPAVQDIIAPFELSADDIVEGLEQDGKTIVHNVMDGERVLFSTVSKPLAFAFIQGHNTAAKAQRTVETEKGDSSGEGGKAAERDPAEVDPAGSKTESAAEKAKPAPKPSPSEKPEPPPAKADAAPRKRVTL